MADVFLFFSRTRKREREIGFEVLLHDIAGLHGKPGVVFAVIAVRDSVAGTLTKSSRYKYLSHYTSRGVLTVYDTFVEY